MKLKEKLMLKLFKNEYNEIIKECNAKVRDYKDELDFEYMIKNRKTEKMYDLIAKNCTIDNSEYVALIGESKTGDTLVVTVNGAAVCVYSEKTNNSLIPFTLKEYKRTIEFPDVIMRPIDEHYGTYAMKALIKYAKDMHVSLLVGDLSAADEDHKDRRDHFYEKFGFENDGRFVKLRLE